jgi:hypothetical protein
MVGTNRAILFRRGDTFATTNKGISVAGPGLIGAYGSGNRPILVSTGGGFTVSGADWRIMDLEVQGASGAQAIDFNASVRTVNMLALRVRAPGMATGFGWSDYSTVLSNPHDGCMIVDSEAVGASINGVYVGGRRIALLGNNIHDVPNSHAARVWMAHKGVISNNRLWNPGPTRHALKLHGGTFGGQRPETRWVSVSDNLVRGTQWTMPIGPQDAGQDERVSHVVVERNRFYGQSGIQADLMIHARQVMVRDNLFDGTGSYGEYKPITVNQLGKEPAPLDVRVYNNTVVRNDSAVSVYGLSVSSVSQNVTFRNNLVSAPLASTVALVTGTGGTGFVSDHNLLSATPGFANASGGDYSLQPGSPAIGAGATLWEVRYDFLGRPRSSSTAFDVGAFKAP